MRLALSATQTLMKHDWWKIWTIILFSLIILTVVCIYNRTCIENPKTQTEELKVIKAREDFVKDSEEKEYAIKPVISNVSIPLVIVLIDSSYEKFQNNFENNKDEMDANP